MSSSHQMFCVAAFALGVSWGMIVPAIINDIKGPAKRDLIGGGLIFLAIAIGLFVGGHL